MSEPKSMGKFHPGLLNDWDYVNNTDIDPMRVSTSGSFACHGGHDDFDLGAGYGGAGRFADGSSFLKSHSLF